MKRTAAIRLDQRARAQSARLAPARVVHRLHRDAEHARNSSVPRSSARSWHKVVRNRFPVSFAVSGTTYNAIIKLRPDWASGPSDNGKSFVAKIVMTGSARTI